MKTAFLFALLFSLASCSTTIEGNRYRSSEVSFDPKIFFDGKIKAWGIVQDRKGNVTQQFTVDIIGAVDQDTITLDETFHYQLGDGVKHRVWTINKQGGQNTLTGKASDVPFAEGETFGNAMRWTYSMNIPYKDSTIEVTLEDWMWAFDKQHLINRSYVRKFGFVVAEVTIFMQKI